MVNDFTPAYIHSDIIHFMVGQVGLEPTTALSTEFTVRGDTNYAVLTHICSFPGIFVEAHNRKELLNLYQPNASPLKWQSPMLAFIFN